MSDVGGGAEVTCQGLSGPFIAEVVEEVPASRILETMVQREACHRIKVVQQAAVMNHCCENSHCSDFFDSLSHLRSFEDLADDQQVAKGGWFSFGRLCGE
jgi:hypothetical protein